MHSRELFAGHICSVMIIYPQVAITFHSQRHATVLSESMIHLQKTLVTQTRQSQ